MIKQKLTVTITKMISVTRITLARSYHCWSSLARFTMRRQKCKTIKNQDKRTNQRTTVKQRPTHLRKTNSFGSRLELIWVSSSWR